MPNFSGLAGAAADLLQAGADALLHGEGAFELRAGPFSSGELAVTDFRGREGISSLFSFNVRIATSIDPLVVQGMVLAAPAQFLMTTHEHGSRIIDGIVDRIQPEGLRSDYRHQIRLRIVPKFALLRHNKGSRIFQKKTVPEVVGAILEKAQIPHEFRLQGKHPPKEYRVQYQESDYDFIMRLLAEEGIFYFFQGPDALGAVTSAASTVASMAGIGGGDKSADGGLLVFGDTADTYRAIAGTPPIPTRFSISTAPVLLFRDTGSIKSTEEHVFRFEMRRSVGSNAVHLFEYDFQRPLFRVSGRSAGPGATLVAPAAALPTSLGGLASAALGALANAGIPAPSLPVLEVYDHHGEDEQPDFDETKARVALDQLTRRALVVRGQSDSRRLLPGHRFSLEEHTEEFANQTYVVTEVRHRGRVPERQGEVQAASRVYENNFECVPEQVVFRPKRAAAAVSQCLETAEVVGPDGEDIYTDAAGRIKVQFHWDLDGKKNEHSSCWIRVGQTWSGVGFGAQFIPRVGMEVLVSFLGGDPDRPMIIGCVYNTAHPVPFRLPEEKTRSGLRTQTTPGGDGHNELSFEDAAGKEQIYLRAERDLDEVVLHDHSVRVENDENITIKGNRNETIVGEQNLKVATGRTVTVEKSDQRIVQGNSLDAVSGDADMRVSRDRQVRVEGKDKKFVTGDREEEIQNDTFLRLIGSHTMLVGRHDAKRSALLHVEGTNQLSSTGITEIQADEGLVLRSGESTIHMTPESIEIRSSKIIISAEDTVYVAADKAKMVTETSTLIKSDKVVVKSSGAVVGLSSEAKIGGSQIKLGSSDNLDDSMPGHETIQPTVIRLSDRDGKPVPNRPFVLVFDDGSQRMGVLDNEGKAKFELEKSGTIIFRDLDEVDQA